MMTDKEDRSNSRTRPHILAIRLYRVTPGDCGVQNFSSSDTDMDAAKEATRARLLEYFKSPHYRPGEQPHTADIFDADTEEVLSVFQVRPGKGDLEVIELPYKPDR